MAKFLALSKDKQLAYQVDLKAKLDYQNVMNYAREYAKEEGKKEGREEGRKEEKIEIAKNLLLAKVDIETIMKSTGLSIEDIEKI